MTHLPYAIFVIVSVFNFSYVYTQAVTPLTVHVLDNSIGAGAGNVSCKLYKQRHSDFQLVTSQITDATGRATLVPADEFKEGIYRIWLDTKTYFNSKGMDTFWPVWETTFHVKNTTIDHHIPVTFCQFGFTTYRGS